MDDAEQAVVITIAVIAVIIIILFLVWLCCYDQGHFILPWEKFGLRHRGKHGCSDYTLSLLTFKCTHPYTVITSKCCNNNSHTDQAYYHVFGILYIIDYL
jgi:hypothetical protein